MTNIFLKAKHWQIFALVIGLPFLFQLLLMVFMFLNLPFQNGDFRSGIFVVLGFLPLLLILSLIVFIGWFWSVGNGLQKFLPEGMQFEMKKFKFSLLFPFFYMLLLTMLIGNNFFGFSFITGIGRMFFFIIPLHLLSMFCMGYLLYFVSKTIKSVEMQREARVNDHLGEFFMLWFFPLGIWVIQAKDQ